MSRKQRRALARFLGRAKGNRTDARIEALELENQVLQDRIDALRGKVEVAPGVVEGQKDWFVTVGGEQVEVKAIPPVEWVRVLNELPGFLFAFALEKVKAPEKPLSDETVTEIMEVARRWLTACAKDPAGLHLERLTFPEAQHVVAHIADLNGVAAYLRLWFRRRLDGVAGGSPGGEDVRRAPEPAPGDLPN